MLKKVKPSGHCANLLQMTDRQNADANSPNFTTWRSVKKHCFPPLSKVVRSVSWGWSEQYFSSLLLVQKL